MAPRTHSGNAVLAAAIRERRQALGLSIEEAAGRSGVGTKTWSRYEAGASIRSDKIRGVCKALGWTKLSVSEDECGDEFGALFNDVGEDHVAWSATLVQEFGKTCATVFAVGCDLLSDEIAEDLKSLAHEPRGTHVGQLQGSMLDGDLPPQFVPRYDYEFVFSLRSAVNALREHFVNGTLVAGSVIEELALYLIMQKAETLADLDPDSFMGADKWREWVGAILGDLDIEWYLFGTRWTVTPRMPYHFDHWGEQQFWSDTNGQQTKLQS